MTDVYAESRDTFERLTPSKYADWVVTAFPWKLWGTAPWSAFDGFQWFYALAIRAPGDPKRSSREQIQAAGLGYGVQYEELRRHDVAWFTEAILRATEDGRPRTLNRIGVEAFNMTADNLPLHAILAVYELLYSEQLAFAMMGNRGSKKDQFYILLWNDAKWREDHPRARTRRFEVLGQMELEDRSLPIDEWTKGRGRRGELKPPSPRPTR